MVSLQVIQQSNAQIAALPKGLVALFIGATSGIGLSALQQFVQYAPAPRIYSVAREASRASHEEFLSSLRKVNPSGDYNLIVADVSLVSEVDKVAAALKAKETKLDLLFMSPGFIAFEGRKDTREGLDPSMTTRYYSRQRALELVLPLLNNSELTSPRVVSVLAGGMEAAINEEDLDLRDSKNWSFWNSSVHSATMATLAFERVARSHPRLSIVHSYPGPVITPGLVRAAKFGLKTSSPQSQEEGGARALFYATSDRYGVKEGLVPLPEQLGVSQKTGGGVFLVDALSEGIDNEAVLSDMRQRKVDEKVWDFTHKLFAKVDDQSRGTNE
jgi:NAD(P)-dependent dehydrogenase (short-subunit alcohol dehydrogenase family)